MYQICAKNGELTVTTTTRVRDPQRLYFWPDDTCAPIQFHFGRKRSELASEGFGYAFRKRVRNLCDSYVSKDWHDPPLL